MKRIIVTAVAAAILVAPSLASAHDAPEDRTEARGEMRIEHQAPQSRQNSGHAASAQADVRHAAPPRPQSQQHQQAQPQPQHYTWHQGDRFDRHRAPHYTRVVHVEHYGLHQPQPGYVWVRSGVDALLVRLSNNIVIGISPNVFH